MYPAHAVYSCSYCGTVLEEDDLKRVNADGNSVWPFCTWAVNLSIIEHQNKSDLWSNNKLCGI